MAEEKKQMSREDAEREFHIFMQQAIVCGKLNQQAADHLRLIQEGIENGKINDGQAVSCKSRVECVCAYNYPLVYYSYKGKTWTTKLAHDMSEHQFELPADFMKALGINYLYNCPAQYRADTAKANKEVADKLKKIQDDVESSKISGMAVECQSRVECVCAFKEPLVYYTYKGKRWDNKVIHDMVEHQFQLPAEFRMALDIYN